MNSHRQTEFVRKAIKKIMQEKNLVYADLAKALGVSLPTIKRILSREAISLDRLSQICRCLAIDFYDLMTLAKQLDKSELEHLSNEQEMFLVQFPKACRFLIEIMNFQTPERIAQRFALSKRSVASYLSELTKMGLVYQKRSGEIQVTRELLKGPRPNGPLQQELSKRYRKFLPELVEREFEREIEAKRALPPRPSPETIAANGFNLTNEARLALLQDLKDLRNKFAEIERLQAQTISPDLLRPVTFLTLLTEGSLYAKAFGTLN